MFDVATIFAYLKRTFTKKDVLVILLLVLLYFLTRLINLDRFPIFTDEGIYIHWAKIAWHDATWRFISLTDGKQPLQTWLTIPFLKLFPNNALLAGRLFSVTMGFAAATGMFCVLLYLFGKRAAFWGSFLYITTPFFMFYDRMALQDSAVNAGAIWILFFSILLVRTLRLDIALLFGLSAGFALLAKSSVRLFLGLSALAPFISWHSLRTFKSKITHAINYYVLYGIAGILALLIYNVQRLSPFLHFVEEKNTTFVLTFSEFLKNPLSQLPSNLTIIPHYVAAESGWVLPFAGLVGLYLLFKKYRGLSIYLALWFILPYVAIAAFAKVLFPRYLIFFASILIVLMSYLMVTIKKQKTFLIVLFIYILSVAYFDFTILMSPSAIPFPQVDRGQYIEGGPAGFGIKQIVEYARSQSQSKPVIILAEGNFGMSGDVLDSSLASDDKITIRGYWPLSLADVVANQKDLDKNTILVVFYQNKPEPNWPLHLIQEYPKPNNVSSFTLYQLTHDTP